MIMKIKYENNYYKLSTFREQYKNYKKKILSLILKTNNNAS